MNRVDWTIVGLRLLGVYLAVNGLLGFLDVFAMGQLGGGDLAGLQAFKAFVTVVIGAALFVRAHPMASMGERGREDLPPTVG